MPTTALLSEALATLPEEAGDQQVLDRMLEAMRLHLNMDVAYLSRRDGRTFELQAMNGAEGERFTQNRETYAHLDDYCSAVLDGALPELIPDAARFPATAAMPITAAAGIGAYVGVPVHRPDGTLFGMLCCLSHSARPDLNERDRAVLQAFSRVAADLVMRRRSESEAANEVRARIRNAIDNCAFDVVFQPIHELITGDIRGVEALTRFHGPPDTGPNHWIQDAARIGMQAELESAILSRALDLREGLPRGKYLSVNVSPTTLVSPDLQAALDGHDTLGLILELTEHVEIPSEAALERAITLLRNRGVKLAIDDVGSGYSGLSQILRFRPDYLKLDMSLVSGLETDAAKRSLAMAMQHFAREIGAKLIAEGIEREEEAYALRMLGVTLGQGYFLGRPGPLGDLDHGTAA